MNELEVECILEEYKQKILNDLFTDNDITDKESIISVMNYLHPNLENILDEIIEDIKIADNTFFFKMCHNLKEQKNDKSRD